MDAEGALLVTAQAERSQKQNLARARDGLRRLILKALPTPKRRVATKPTRAAQRRRLEQKRQRSQRKKSRARVSNDGE